MIGAIEFDTLSTVLRWEVGTGVFRRAIVLTCWPTEPKFAEPPTPTLIPIEIPFHPVSLSGFFVEENLDKENTCSTNSFKFSRNAGEP